MLDGQDVLCPVCQKSFDADNDVVVCPFCGAPHHRRCYEEKNDCFFSGRHGEGRDWRQFVKVAREPTRPETKPCPVCGQENEIVLFFCKRCGENLLKSDPVSQYKGERPPTVFDAAFPFSGQGSFVSVALDPYAGMNPKDKIGVHTVEEFSAYVGLNTVYYLPRFRDMAEGGKNVFNCAGAFLSAFWCFFRGMRLPGVVFFLVMLGSAFVRSYFTALYTAWKPTVYENMLSSVLQMLLMGGLMCLAGFLANTMYYKRCIRQITRIKAENPADLLGTLKVRGGVKPRNAYVAVACFAVLSVLLSLLIQFVV